MSDSWCMNVNVFAVQRAVCSGSGPFEGTGWSWVPSLCLMLGLTPVWPRIVRAKHRKTTPSQCRVKSLQFQQNEIHLSLKTGHITNWLHVTLVVLSITHHPGLGPSF